MEVHSPPTMAALAVPELLTPSCMPMLDCLIRKPCSVDLRRTTVSDVPEFVSAFDTLSVMVETVDKGGNHCETGGVSFRMEADGAVALSGEVVDLMNGSYIGSMWMGPIPGPVTISVIVDFVGCQGTALCHRKQTQTILLHVVDAQNTTIVNASGGEVPRDVNGVWSFGQDEPTFHSVLPELDRVRKGTNVEALRNKWMVMVGDSRLNHLCYALGRKRLLQSNYTMKNVDTSSCSYIRRRSSNYALFHNEALNFTLTCSRIYQGYDIETSTYSLTNVSRCAAEQQLVSSTEASPHALLFNIGLHRVNRFAVTLEMASFAALMESIMMPLEQRIQKNGLVYWGSTLTTHWMHHRLHSLHSCRTRHRLQCMNELSDKVLEKHSRWRYFGLYKDLWRRSDCAPDNRHYFAGNCNPIEADIFLSRYIMDSQ